jgi:hypothetical protein
MIWAGSPGMTMSTAKMAIETRRRVMKRMKVLLSI